MRNKNKSYVYQQSSLFDFAYPSFRFTKPIRLIELFAGYGSQALSLEYLKTPFESYRICEWAIPSFEAYKRLHCHDDRDYSKGKGKSEIVDELCAKGVSVDWNKPVSKTLLMRKPEAYIREAYNAMEATHNLVDISKAKGSDFAMSERDRYQVIMTYSFPCQDLSLAGERKGMDEGSETRSSLLWQVQRILSELKALGQLPDCLLMENVIQIHSEDNRENLNKWQSFLSSLGYKNYISDLEATDFGIPQTRDRCFMVSLLGDYSYQFPMPSKLTVRLKDLLEKKVDERYYLSDSVLKKIIAWKSFRNPLEQAKDDKSSTSNCVTAKSNTTLNASMLLLKEANEVQTVGNKNGHQLGQIVSEDGSNPSIVAGNHGLPGGGVLIKNATQEGYLVAHDGDGVYLSNVKGKRGMVQKNKVQTIKAGTDVGVVVTAVIDLYNQRELKSGNACTIKTNESSGWNRSGTGIVEPKVEQIGNIHPDREGFKNSTDGRVYDPSKCSPTLGTMGGGNKQPIVVEKNGSSFTDEQASMFDENGNVKRYIGDERTDEFKEGQAADISFPKGYNKGPRVHDTMPALNTTTTQNFFCTKQEYRIRKLTPRECFRLMGVKDSDFDKIDGHLANSTLYHLAGDSIVVNVLMAIFKQMGLGD